MKNPSRTLVNWLAVGLIVLFIWVLLASIIAPRLRESAAGAGNLLEVTATPPITLTPDLSIATPMLDGTQMVMLSAPSGAVMTKEQVGAIPPDTRVRIATWGFEGETLIFTIVTLDGQINAKASPEQLMLDPAWNPAMPTVPPYYSDAAYWSNCYPLMLTEDIAATGAYGAPTGGTIPAGTRVHVSSMAGAMEYREGKGYVWVYDIVAQPETQALDPNSTLIHGHASEDQLTQAPDAQVVPGGATPTSQYMNDSYGYNFILTTGRGNLREGARVMISSGYLDCDEWVYQVVVENGTSAWVRASDLSYSPDYTPGAPTATYVMPPTTATATFPAPAASPTYTRTPSRVIGRTLGDPHTVLRSQPTLDPDTVIAQVPPGTELPIIGRWVGYDWYLVQWSAAPDHSGQAWVYAQLVEVQGDITTVNSVTPAP